VPAAFADSIPLDAHQRAADYTLARVRLARVDLAVGAALLLTLTLGGGLNVLFDLASRFVSPGGYAHGMVFIGLLGMVNWLVELPFGLYRTFGIEARFGFNKTTWRLYLADTAKGVLLTALIGAPMLLAVLWLMDSMGEHWWLYVWLFWSGFNLLVLLVYPVFIAPLFNKFTPLDNPELKTRIEALLARCGFASSGLYVMDGSRRSSHGNAYFTGFGRAKRIVFFDTLLSSLTPSEIEAVLAHELGHYHHRHIWKRIALIFAGSLGLLFVLGQLMGQSWFYEGLGFAHQGTAAALVLFMLASPVFLYPLSPLMSLLSRKHEFQADAFAAKQTAAADLVSALVKLYRDNAATLTPDPIYSAMHDSHPPAGIRIRQLTA
jgi:STE24 endopeptidase